MSFFNTQEIMEITGLYPFTFDMNTNSLSVNRAPMREVMEVGAGETKLNGQKPLDGGVGLQKHNKSMRGTKLIKEV